MKPRRKTGGCGKKLLALSVAAAVNINPVSVLAQDAELEEVTITGSRIRATDGMAEPTPVTSLTPLELMNFEPGGTVAEQLDALPQFFATGTAQRGGNGLFGDGGGSYLDMRGLGRNRTLVLLDGSRIVPADKRSTVNVDNIPTALVRSVDVVTGGASAAYGADALGGVTNFVLDREFEGLKVSVSTGMNEFNQDGKNHNFSIAGGTQIGDRLNVIGSVEARHIDQIERLASELDADWFQRWGYLTLPPGNEPRRITRPWVAPTNISPAGVISGTRTSLDGLTFTNDGKNVRPMIRGDEVVGTTMSGGPEAINYSNATDSPIQGNGVDNRSGFLGLQYEVSDNLSIFGQALIGRTESTDQEFRGNFAMSSLWTLTIFRENPFIPGYISETESVPGSVAGIMDANGVDSFRLAKIGGYPGELGPGSNEYSKTVFSTESYSAGFDYTFDNSWNLRGSYQTGESRKRGGEYPSLRVDREALSRDAVLDANGRLVCNVQRVNPTEEQLRASPENVGHPSTRQPGDIFSPIGLDNTVRDCIPYNAMGTEGSNQAAIDYMATAKIADTWVKQDFAELLLTGDAHEGWGYGPVSFATGLTWREQSFADTAAIPYDVDALGPPQNDPALGIRGIAPVFEGGNPNLHFFSTINTISGEYDVWEWFAELQAPIWESSDGAQRLAGNVAFRRSDYSSSGEMDSWKMGLEFQVIEDLRLRATRSRDVREASFSERFDGATGGAGVDDPFTGQTNVNVSTVSGGNPNLRPEFADTVVFGFVYEPGWLQGLSLSTDWYDVDISDSVDTITFQQVVDQCFETGTLCENLTRNAEGSLSLVNAPYLNLANATVEGLDFELRYSFEPDFFDSSLENFNFRAIVGHLIERSDTPPQGSPIDLIGSTLRPENTGTVVASYSAGPWGVQWQQRFIDETKVNINWVEGVDIDDNSIPFYTFTNLQFSYSSEMANGGDWRVSLAVNNAFDKNPPIIPGYFDRIGSQTGGLSGFDEWGRRYQLSLNVNF